MFESLPERQYDIVLIDPPWYYKPVPPDKTYVNTAARHYDLISDADLLTMPIERLLTRQGVLYMWATCPRLDMAIRFGESRGLLYRGVPFVWAKTRKDGAIMGAKGMRPATVKPVVEIVLAFSRSKKIIRPALENVRQVVLANRREHSRKPDEIQDQLDLMYPSASKLEVFARQTRPGWDVWGNDTLRFPNERISVEETSTY